MPYSEFTLARVKKQFDLTTSEDTDIFAAVPELGNLWDCHFGKELEIFKTQREGS